MTKEEKISWLKTSIQELRDEKTMIPDENEYRKEIIDLEIASYKSQLEILKL